MKEYNRETRRWEEKTTGEGKFKKRDSCRGGREHDYIICLPSWVKVTHDIVPKAIEEYYLSEERRKNFEVEEDKKLAELGIRMNRWNLKVSKTTRHLRCVICDKRKYQE